jgi:hypothetical protein
MHAFEVTLERIDVDRPEAAERLEPGVYLAKSAGNESDVANRRESSAKAHG